MTSSKKQLISVVVAIEVVLAALAWRDMARLPTTRVRGSKAFWRVFVTINPGNAVAYWLLGRRRAATS
jgi:hypothetical protein